MEAAWSSLLQASMTQHEMPSMNSFLAQMHLASVAGHPPMVWPEPETKLFRQPFWGCARGQPVFRPASFNCGPLTVYRVHKRQV